MSDRRMERLRDNVEETLRALEMGSRPVQLTMDSGRRIPSRPIVEAGIISSKMNRREFLWHGCPMTRRVTCGATRFAHLRELRQEGGSRERR